MSVDLLKGGKGRPYFAETRRQAIGWLARNIWLNGGKLLGRGVDFHYVNPDLTNDTGGDHDMVYYASPIDLRRYLARNGAAIVSWSGVSLRRPVLAKPLTLRGSGIKRMVAQSLAWPITGMTYIVARKHKSIGI